MFWCVTAPTFPSHVLPSILQKSLACDHFVLLSLLSASCTYMLKKTNPNQLNITAPNEQSRIAYYCAVIYTIYVMWCVISLHVFMMKCYCISTVDVAVMRQYTLHVYTLHACKCMFIVLVCGLGVKRPWCIIIIIRYRICVQKAVMHDNSVIMHFTFTFHILSFGKQILSVLRHICCSAAFLSDKLVLAAKINDITADITLSSVSFFWLFQLECYNHDHQNFLWMFLNATFK